MVKHHNRPTWLKGITPEPADVEEYTDASSNALRLLEYLRINNDALTLHDLKTMMVVELERDYPREDVLIRIKGKYNVLRTKEEHDQLISTLEKHNE